ncbi:MAG: pantoate--beta-alanine ligase [Desulfococcus sp. 4484_241]|nr:MAG: pantoate--beta-alanine ligase [Desulfococcus sp. 4484_241]
MEIIKTAKDMQAHAEKTRMQGKTIVFVPTMGFLHEGHLSLLREGSRHGDHLVLSIFVNPTQFAAGEDFESYPRDFEKDAAAAQKEGVDVIFAPEKANLYDDDFETYVSLEKLPNHLCGLSRPTHFRGVATIVTKLFNIVKPHAAVFGEKDYQQLAIIRRMTRDLNFDIRIIGVPIVREPDGLAMSSRNTYLAPEQRQAALSLYRSLSEAQNMVKTGETRATRLIEEARRTISAFPENSIDYVTVCDPDTLEDVALIDRPVLMALAVRVGKCRLIDNMVLHPAG